MLEPTRFVDYFPYLKKKKKSVKSSKGRLVRDVEYVNVMLTDTERLLF
jgi:hypothetical protein